MSEPRFDVQHFRHVEVPTRDGVRLSASLFMPVDGEGRSDGPYPAILEYLPYRKDDHTAARWNTHYYLAQRGYVGVRLDVRGTGSSEGTVDNEYTLQEQEDGYDAIEWLAEQPWSNGKVGMWGTSYGGFNCIQVATHQPPHLAAIAPHAATDDRYNDDVHYSGGCLTCLEQLEYPLMMVAMNAVPPHPDILGERWEAIWQEHLESPPWLLEWFEHQRDGAYWANGSLKTDYTRIACPVLMLGGWNDGYTNSIFRMLERLEVPTRAVIGPWTHMRPDGGYAGPHIHYLDILERWWAHWLLHEENGIMDEPKLAIYVQEWYPPARFPETIPGEWRYEAEWPVARVRERVFDLSPDGRLSEWPADEGHFTLQHDPTIGVTAPCWCPTAPPQGMARDTREDDVRSLTFDLNVEEGMEILGTPKAILHVSATAPVAAFTVKLVDVASDGRSTFITRGTLNATRRDDMDTAEPLEPGTVYQLEIPLKIVSWKLAVGHRLLLSIATADWPTLWPTPYPMDATLYLGPDHPSRIILPTVPAGSSATEERPSFSEPVDLPATVEAAQSHPNWHTTRDEVSGAITVNLFSTGYLQPKGLELKESSIGHSTAKVSPDDPGNVTLEGRYEFHQERPDGHVDVTASARITSTIDEFRVWVNLAVDRNDRWVAGKTWEQTFPRDLL